MLLNVGEEGFDSRDPPVRTGCLNQLSYSPECNLESYLILTEIKKAHRKMRFLMWAKRGSNPRPSRENGMPEPTELY